ncbi:MAG: peptidoglycan bridge formation glycyltransferase FemA/FemB family protein [Candidatus Komeilibacteria bacterium]|nr:peptidoglycan bridge formation glycyltransferase FemA/FemB family protein [Candidatus Komeilibacteria bacterium]
MELKQINQQELGDFISSQPHSQFLQSWSWGEFQKSLNRQAWSYGVFNNAQIVASAGFIEMPLGFKKSYLYCPRGPIIKNNLPEEQKTEALKLILSKARDLTIETKQAEEIFFRFEPTFEIKNLNLEIQPTLSIQPQNTLILDLQKSTEELLDSFHGKTRYNIKLAEKHGVKITKLAPADFNRCWPLFLATGKRDAFGLHPLNYYQKMLQLKEAELWVAEIANNAIIAANFMIFYGDTVTYLHGASNYNFRNLMAPALLQWALIKEAKNRSFKYYDFHGVAPDDNSQHPWAGVTRFKNGFGGEIANYSGTYDFIYEPGWYKIYQWLRKINRIIKL